MIPTLCLSTPIERSYNVIEAAVSAIFNVVEQTPRIVLNGRMWNVRKPLYRYDSLNCSTYLHLQLLGRSFCNRPFLCAHIVVADDSHKFKLKPVNVSQI